MRIYSNKTVFEASLERIRYLFDEFENVIVGFSGGKDSTVVLNLTLQVAKEKNRLPQKVFFLDQEAEWELVIKYMRKVMYRKDVEPLWLQIPFKMTNSSSHEKGWLYSWDENNKENWLREKEPISIKENRFKTDRFAQMFGKFIETDYPDKKTCYLSGVRTEESPTRFTALTSAPTYKHITYGKILNKKLEHYTFYPVYDWSYKDIWKAIHENNWDYTELYDKMYQYGVPIQRMRVSNVHHETALESLFYMQEIEPELWEKLTERLEGINTVGQLQKEQFYIPKELPYMFNDWEEYRNYLLENLIQKEEHKNKFRKKFNQLDELYIHSLIRKKLMKECINALIINDYDFVKIGNFERRPAPYGYKLWRIGKPMRKDYFDNNKYIQDAIKEDNSRS